jgi:ketosteroid isomerase-like protein
MSTTGDLEGRVALLEDERAILRLLHSYGHYLDYGLADAWVDCFTEDGVFEVQRATPPGGLYRGRDELRGFVAAHTHAPDKWHKHVVVDPIITVHGDSAEVESYFMRLDRIDDLPQVRTFGRYRDSVRRTAEGRWRLAHRVVEVEARIT